MPPDAAQTADHPDCSHRLRRWLKLGLLLIPVAMIIGHSVWVDGARRRLDALVATYRAAGEPARAEDLDSAFVPDDQNGVADLRAAAGLVQTKTDTWQLYDRVDRLLPLTAAERAAIEDVAQENAAAYARLDQALAKPGADWQMRARSPLISVVLPDLTAQRTLANALAAQMLAAHARGDDAEALRRIDQIWQIARRMDHYVPCLVQHLVATGIRAMASENLIRLAPDLHLGPDTADPVRKLLADLGDEQPIREGFRRAIGGERLMVYDTANEVVAGRLTLQNLGVGAGRQGGSGFGTATAYVAGPLILQDTRTMLEMLTTLGRAAQEPSWPAARAKASGLGQELRQHHVMHFWFNMMMPSLDRAVATNYRALGDARLARAALACRAYAADHRGRLPATLGELVPTYLAAVPADPFATDGTPIRYIPDEPDPRIYSVGENGKDDGGSDTTTRPNGGRWERGDAVVHLRLPPRDFSNVPDELKDAPTKPSDK